MIIIKYTVYRLTSEQTVESNLMVTLKSSFWLSTHLTSGLDAWNKKRTTKHDLQLINWLTDLISTLKYGDLPQIYHSEERRESVQGNHEGERLTQVGCGRFLWT